MKLWTPTLSFDNPGTSSFSYYDQQGFAYRTEGGVTLSFEVTAVITKGTASGALRIGNMPYLNQGGQAIGTILHAGFTNSAYLHRTIQSRVQLNSNYALLQVCDQGQSIATIQASDITSGDTVVLWGTVSFGLFPLEASPYLLALMGDSIIANCAWQNYRNNILNAGVSGNTTAQMVARFSADVLAHSPATVGILGGNNDSTASIANIVTMAQAARSAGVRAILCTRTPVYWPDTNDGSDQGLIDLSQGQLLAHNEDLKIWASANDFTLVDLYSAMLKPDGTQNRALFITPSDPHQTTHPIALGYDVIWAELEKVL